MTAAQFISATAPALAALKRSIARDQVAIICEFACLLEKAGTETPVGWKPTARQAYAAVAALKGGDRISKIWPKSGRISMASGLAIDA